MAREKTNGTVELPKLLTLKKAHAYLGSQGLEFSTQQVRNLARTNDLIKAGVQDYTDPVTEETTKVIDQSALDNYIVWRRENPDAVRSGRKSDPNAARKYSAAYTPDQLETINAWLNAANYPILEQPTRKPRDPNAPKRTRKSKNVDASNEPVQMELAEVSELELIEV